MRKTLRGKRHIRARRSVEIGWDKRRAMKADRNAKRIIKTLMMLPGHLASQLQEVGRAIQGIGNVFSELFYRLLENIQVDKCPDCEHGIVYDAVFDAWFDYSTCNGAGIRKNEKELMYG
jgi:hypothetical protein